MTNELKKAIRNLGVADRFRVCMIRDTLHVYLSKAVREDAALLSKVEALIIEKTGCRSFSVPGAFRRYTIVPTFEAQA